MNAPTNTPPQIRRHDGWEIRNAEGLYWSAEEGWQPVGMRWSGFSRREMKRLAREAGGVLVQITRVRRSRSGRAAVMCSACVTTSREVKELRARVLDLQSALPSRCVDERPAKGRRT